MKRLRPSLPHAGSISFRWLVLAPLGIVFCAFILIGLGLLAFYFQLDRSLPSVQSLKNYRPPLVSTMYAADGSLMGEFYAERRYLVPLEKIPPHLIKAFLAAEDVRFYEHVGVDPMGIMRAFLKNIEAGEIVQGGSTITQQVVKSLLLTPERTWIRKLKEAILAQRIDRWLSKDEILYLYLNQIYLGSGAYGVEAAAQTYFGKSVDKLNLAESALLAGLPKAPSTYSPFRHFSRARERQQYVLQRMAEVGFISSGEAQEAFAHPLELTSPKRLTLEEMNFFSEEVRRRVEARYGYDGLYKGGLKIYTTMDPRVQNLAEKSLNKGLRELDKRHGYRGPHRRVPREEWPAFLKQLTVKNGEPEPGKVVEAFVESFDPQSGKCLLNLGAFKGELPFSGWKWTGISSLGASEKFQKGAVIWVRLTEKISDALWLTSMEQEPKVQGALMAMVPQTGKVLCMVGGRNLEQSQFNRVTQAVRQPGSAFKPIVYAAALDKGFTPASVLIDTPVAYKGSSLRNFWSPSNYDHKFWGAILLRKALIHSRNVVTVKLLDEIGIDYVVNYARKLGIESYLTPTLSLALGASGVSLWELTTAYSVFANQGKRTTPYLIEKILDRNGNVLEKHQVQTESVISPQTAFIITDMLRGVIQEGTGKRAKKLGRPAAGKTGTTNDLRDAWFMGYTPSLLTGVWVGHDDDKRSLGPRETGGQAACPIWLDFMEKCLKDQPVEDFSVPKGIVFVKMNPNTGALAKKNDPNAVNVAFNEKKMPPKRSIVEKRPSATPSAAASAATKSAPPPDSFFKSDLF